MLKLRHGTVLVSALVVSLVLLLSITLEAADTTADIFWSTYHNDPRRTGFNPDADSIDNPGTLDLIWTFPRGDLGTVEDSDPSVRINGAWTQAFEGSGATQVQRAHKSILESQASVYYIQGNSTPTQFIEYPFPREQMQRGGYHIYVYVGQEYSTASGDPPVNTKSAKYVVYDDDGAIQCLDIDQSASESQETGRWMRLVPNSPSTPNKTYFNFFNPTIDHRVVLSNQTSDGNPADFVVTADAVAFVQAGFQGSLEQYTSPSVAQIPYEVDYGSLIPSGNSDYSGDIPVFYVATVETPLSDELDGVDTGAVYCVNGVTPITTKLSEFTGSDSELMTRLSTEVGKTLWRYPRAVDPGDAWNINKKRDPLEGPISGGFYASPTIAYANIEGENKAIVIAAGMDSQIYVFDAEGYTEDSSGNPTIGNNRKAKLLWKGPGLTKSEYEVMDIPGDWDNVGTDYGFSSDREDSFGGQYLWAKCSSSTTKEIVWEFPDDERQAAGEPIGSGSGWQYSVYVWVPTHLPGNGDTPPAHRAEDAEYTVVYDKPGEPNAENVVLVNQKMNTNDGKWINLGSYFNVKEVKLSNKTASGSPDDCCVVADAVMIVPSQVNIFSYCTPITDVDFHVDPDDGSNHLSSTIYATTNSGRVLSFDISGSDFNLKAGKVNWVYPQIRNKLVVTGHDDDDQAPLGNLVSSPVYIGLEHTTVPRLLVSDLDGEVYAIKNIGPAEEPEELWQFPNTNDLADGIKPSGFQSSPAFDEMTNQILIGSIDGVFYSLRFDAAPGSEGQMYWRSPEVSTDPATGGAAPFGAIRFSTAAIGNDDDGFRRAWVGSSDGKVYSFSLSDPHLGNSTTRRLTTDTTPYYSEPSYNAAVWGSPALDNKNTVKRPVFYVGDMTDSGGVVRWYDATSGTATYEYRGYTTNGAVFSSPSVILYENASMQRIGYVNVGNEDGRLYAFSPDGQAWGGDYVGGEGPVINSEDRREERIVPEDTEVQFDMFPVGFWEDARNLTSGDLDTNVLGTEGDTNYYEKPTEGTNWIADTIVSEEMKMVDSSKFLLFYPDDPTLDERINKYLTNLAQERRDYVLDYNNQRKQGQDFDYYFEWGESIYFIAWNLPSRESIPGSVESALRIRMMNKSPGQSAGAQIPSIGPILYREYVVLDEQRSKDFGGTTGYAPLQDENGQDVKRGFAIFKFDIKSQGRSIFSPGPGWEIMLYAKRKVATTGDNTRTVQEEIPIAYLESNNGKPLNGYQPVFDEFYQDPDDTSSPVEYRYRPQQVGINNPLGIIDDQPSPVEVAWPENIPAASRRFDEEAHFNGNAGWTSSGSGNQYIAGKMPVMDLGLDFGGVRAVPHGASSRQGALGVIDRSAMGLDSTVKSIMSNALGGGEFESDVLDPLSDIYRFRLDSGDLSWQGGTGEIGSSGGLYFDWDLGIGSVDYPHLSKQYHSYRMALSDVDPTKNKTALMPGEDLGSGTYENLVLRPEALYLSVDVPKFQPANEEGYSRELHTYIDSNLDGRFTTPNQIFGRPSTDSEVYRSFLMMLSVPPDPKIEVEEQIIDIGSAPHGLGMYTTLLDPFWWFQPFNPFNPTLEPAAYDAWDNAIGRWFKKVTVKNSGNVNLPNMKIMGRNLYSDQANTALPVPWFYTVSSLDGNDPLGRYNVEPYLTNDGINSWGYTLSKPRVGDPDPAPLTIPDARKVEMRYSSAPGVDWDLVTKQPVKVSTVLPLSQPVGTYISSPDSMTSLPYVFVYSDKDKDGTIDNNEPYASPGFQMKVTVKEGQVTGGATVGVLPHVDSSAIPKFGDGKAAAVRSVANGDVNLFWSSNRVYDTALLPDPADPNDPKHADLSSAPWFINFGSLDWDTSFAGGSEPGWRPYSPGGGVPPKWWHTPTAGPGSRPFMPNSPMWPSPVPGAVQGATVVDWSPAGLTDPLLSVRHHSPSVSVNPDAAVDATVNRSYLIWTGDADVQLPDGTMTRQYLPFYLDVSNFQVGTASYTAYAIPTSPTMAKRNPSLAVWQESDGDTRMWATWQAGEKGRWALSYTTTDNPNAPESWSEESQFRLADSIGSVSSPNLITKVLWRTPNPVGGTTPLPMFDLVYAGTGTVTNNADIFLTRYVADPDPESPMSPDRRAQPLARVYGEELQRDPKFGFYTSDHIAWMRLSHDALDSLARSDKLALLTDQPGRRTHFNFTDVVIPGYSDPNVIRPEMYNLPYIWVELPEDYNGSGWPAGTTVSATDGSIRDAAGNIIDTNDPGNIVVTVDPANDVYTYKYQLLDGTTTPAGEVLGDMIVDFSSGTIRFTEPLKEIKSGDEYKVPRVYADYTPQTWRLTSDLASDSSPAAFMEKTDLYNRNDAPGYVGLGPVPSSGLTSIDRLWVFWRKVGPGVEGSTIYYKTYRIGVDLTKLTATTGQPAHAVNWITNVSGQPVPQVTSVVNATGPWQVDRSGQKIYFSQVDERYRSLEQSGSQEYGASPGPVVLTYTNVRGATQTVNIEDLTWIEENPEQTLFGPSSESVNENSICAFADPVLGDRNVCDLRDFGGSGTGDTYPVSKIWVFWTSTRQGTSDVFWETVSPNFAAR